MLPKLWCVYLLFRDILTPYFDLIGLGWCLRLYISNELLGDATWEVWVHRHTCIGNSHKPVGMLRAPNHILSSHCFHRRLTGQNAAASTCNFLLEVFLWLLDPTQPHRGQTGSGLEWIPPGEAINWWLMGIGEYPSSLILGWRSPDMSSMVSPRVALWNNACVAHTGHLPDHGLAICFLCFCPTPLLVFPRITAQMNHLWVSNEPSWSQECFQSKPA